MVCLSVLVVPVYLETISDPTQLLRQWARMYHYGSIYAPALSIAACGLYGYLALRKDRNSQQRRSFISAAVATAAIIPFTLIVMAPTNNTLHSLEVSAVSGTAEPELSVVQNLVVRWAWLHLARSIFPFVGVYLGLRLSLIHI